MAAVTLLAIAARTRSSLHALASDLAVYPQVLLNVRVTDKGVANHPAVRAAVAEQNANSHTRGAILVRASGTEPLVRVMVEARDEKRTRALSRSGRRHDPQRSTTGV